MFSVLISIYREEKPAFLERAISSIYSDQILKPNQIVLILDGLLTTELDLKIELLKKELGDILTIVSLDKNVGLGAALNEGLNYCKYDLVVRMDTDDISLPERFAKQIDFMNNHPEIAASSAFLEEWDEELKIKQNTRKLPLDSQEIIKFAKRRSPLSHPLAIFRKDIVLEVGGYPSLRKGQDYALWSLLLNRGYKLANLPDVLLKMRTGNNMLDRRGWNYFKDEYKLLKYQKEIGFLSTGDFLINTSLKACLRIAPNYIKRLAYRFAR